MNQLRIQLRTATPRRNPSPVEGRYAFVFEILDPSYWNPLQAAKAFYSLEDLDLAPQLPIEDETFLWTQYGGSTKTPALDLYPSTFRTATSWTQAQNIPLALFQHYNPLNNRLISFAKLKDGWNGEHTKGVRKASIDRARTLLFEILRSIPDDSYARLHYIEVFPTNDGGVQFEYGTLLRDVELESAPDFSELSILRVDRSTGHEHLLEESVQAASIPSITNWLLAR